VSWRTQFKITGGSMPAAIPPSMHPI